MRRWALGATVALACAGMLAAPGAEGAVVVGGSIHLTASPRRVRPTGDVALRFAQPVVGGLIPGERVVESLLVIGPGHAGCASTAEAMVQSAASGSAMRVVLRPAALAGGRWCTGTFTATLRVARVSTCPIGVQREVCPEYVVVPETVATTRFRVLAAAG